MCWHATNHWATITARQSKNSALVAPLGIHHTTKSITAFHSGESINRRVFIKVVNDCFHKHVLLVGSMGYASLTSLPHRWQRGSTIRPFTAFPWCVFRFCARFVFAPLFSFGCLRCATICLCTTVCPVETTMWMGFCVFFMLLQDIARPQM